MVILFLSRKKFHAKQFVVLSSSMKLAHGVSVRNTIRVFSNSGDRRKECEGRV